jgi:hypothetical protein
MRARVGDRLVVENTYVGEPRRVGVVLDVSHSDGSPPYLIRWLDDGHEALVFPGSDAHIEPSSHLRGRGSD